jgi:hypothetical protein
MAYPLRSEASAPASLPMPCMGSTTLGRQQPKPEQPSSSDSSAKPIPTGY